MELNQRIGRAVIIGTTMAAMLGSSSAAWAFKAQGYSWPNRETEPVTYQIDPAGSDDIPDDSESDAIRRAFMTWQSVACSYLTFAEEPFEQPRRVANDQKHRIMWVEQESDWPGNKETLALTYTFYTLDEARNITDADIIMNGFHWTWTTTDSQVGMGTPPVTDVETVLFHEIGHFLGLDHSDDTNAAMYPSNNKQIQRAPADDDIGGICSIYSNGEPLPTNPGGGRGGPVGAPCRAHSDCSSSICINEQTYNRTYCTQECSPGNAADCPSGFDCVQADANKAYCLAPPVVEELCDQCEVGAHCSTGLCVKVPNVNQFQPFCSRTCSSPGVGSGGCPTGYTCQLTQQNTTQAAVCVPINGICEPKGKGGHMEPCFGDGSCKAGHGCFVYDQGLGLSFCYALCAGSQAGRACSSGRNSVCTEVAGYPGHFACLPFAGAGQPCIPEICAGNVLCAWEPALGIDTAVCYQTCPNGQPDCPANNACKTYQGLAAPVCEPEAGFRLDGSSCASDAECTSGTCRTLGQNSLCTRVCSTSDMDSCEAGLICVPDQAMGTSGLCWPTSYTDPTAQDPTRGGSLVGGNTNLCTCDTTDECDSGCDCDPECAGGSCSCSSVQNYQKNSLWGFLAIVGLVLLRRRRQAR